MDLLLQARASPNVELSASAGHAFRSPLQVALMRGYTEISILLLEAGAALQYNLPYAIEMIKSLLTVQVKEQHDSHEIITKAYNTQDEDLLSATIDKSHAIFDSSFTRDERLMNFCADSPFAELKLAVLLGNFEALQKILEVTGATDFAMDNVFRSEACQSGNAAAITAVVADTLLLSAFGRTTEQIFGTGSFPAAAKHSGLSGSASNTTYAVDDGTPGGVLRRIIAKIRSMRDQQHVYFEFQKYDASHTGNFSRTLLESYLSKCDDMSCRDQTASSDAAVTAGTMPSESHGAKSESTSTVPALFDMSVTLLERRFHTMADKRHDPAVKCGALQLLQFLGGTGVPPPKHDVEAPNAAEWEAKPFRCEDFFQTFETHLHELVALRLLYGEGTLRAHLARQAASASGEECFYAHMHFVRAVVQRTDLSDQKWLSENASKALLNRGSPKNAAALAASIGLRATGSDDKIAKRLLKAVEQGDEGKVEHLLRSQEEAEMSLALAAARRTGERRQTNNDAQVSKYVQPPIVCRVVLP